MTASESRIMDLSDFVFNERDYLAAFPDVAHAVAKGVFLSGLHHYTEVGKQEMADGRRVFARTDPAVRGFRLLDEAPSSAAAAALGRDREPAPAQGADAGLGGQDDRFFEDLYLEINPDVAAAVARGDIPTGEAHYRSSGWYEVRHNTRPTIAFVPRDDGDPAASGPAGGPDAFDGIEYLHLYPDVRHVAKDAAAAWHHWSTSGRHEGRVAPGLRDARRRNIDWTALLSRPLGFNIFGDFTATSGLGTAARSFAKAVRMAGFPVQLWAFSCRDARLNAAAHHAGRQPLYRINLLLANADQIAPLFAAYPAGTFDDAFNIAVWQWELPALRADWFFCFEGLDEIWTNSAYQVAAIRAIAPTPVTRIFLPIAPRADEVRPDRAYFGLPEDSFVFLLSFDTGSTIQRKNPFLALDAFRIVRRAHSKVHLVIKYHCPAGTDETLRQDLVTRSGGDVTMIAGRLDAAALHRLHDSCDCYLSPHRSEGFGLQIAELMAAGKVVVATDYSGNVDFFDAEVGYPIDYDLCEVEETVGPYRAGSIWAEPRLDSLVDAMTAILTDPDEAKRRAFAAQRRVGERLGYDKIARSIHHRIDALQLTAPCPQFVRQIQHADHATRRRHDARRRATRQTRIEGPLFSIVVPVYNVPGRLLAECVGSVIAQTYPYWEICICDDGSTNADTLTALDKLQGSSPHIKIVRNQSNQGIAQATNVAAHVAAGSYIVFLDNDDVLLPDALECVAGVIRDDDAVDVIYTDEEKVDEHGAFIEHFHKPDWSPEHLESVMYVLHMLVVRKALVLRLGGLRPQYDGAQDFDLMLRLSRLTRRIHHIAKVLYRWRAIPGSAAAQVDAKPAALENGRRALEDHARIKYGGGARVDPGLLQGTFRLRRPMPDWRVTLLIVTGNGHGEIPGRGEIHFVDNFIDSIVSKTDYERYEIVVVDNSKLTGSQVQRFHRMGIRVENFYDGGGAFNYAAKLNFALRQVRTDLVVILNDDMEVIREDWLQSMLELLTDPGIGAVGARLLHADGSLQHVGMLLGVNGGAAHPYHCFPGDFVGYNGFTHLVRNYSAVTAACLATRCSTVAEVGWFDERFAIDYNDVDFCLRLIGAGYRIAYTPYAELYHFEGATTKRAAQNPSEVDLFRNRWSRYLRNDPYYNVNLSRHSLDFTRAEPATAAAPLAALDA